MTALTDFLVSYLHYGVSQRLFCDRCRQLIGCEGKDEERQALIDETLRLSLCVSDNAGILEATIPSLMEHLQNDGDENDLTGTVPLIIGFLAEDKERARRYCDSVTRIRIGMDAGPVGRTNVANPFVPAKEQEGGEDA